MITKCQALCDHFFKLRENIFFKAPIKKQKRRKNKEEIPDQVRNGNIFFVTASDHRERGSPIVIFFQIFVFLKQLLVIKSTLTGKDSQKTRII